MRPPRLAGHTARALRAAGALAAALALALGWAIPALAHAELARAEPAPNSVLVNSPPAVQLWFTEAPEPRFSEIAIYTTARVKLNTPPPEVAPEDRNALVVRLDQQLPDGTYTVAWKALSSVDGHTTAGAYAFAVGVGQTVTGPVSGLAGSVGETSQATPRDVAVRWLTYLASSTLLGALAFPLLVLTPAVAVLRRKLPGAETPERRERRDRGRGGSAVRGGPAAARLWPDVVQLAVTRRALQVALVAFWATVILALVAAVAQAARAAGVSFFQALNPSPDAPLATLLLRTRYGQVWLGRVLLLALLALVFSRLGAAARPSRRLRTTWWVALALAALVPLTTSLNSHAAALDPRTAPLAPVVPMLADWVHLVATGAWVGGLVVLLMAVPAGYAAAGPGRRVAFLAALVPEFSALAAACVAALVLTGVYQAVLHVGSWGALFGTTYGQALVVKLVLVAPLLLLGAFNLLFARPRLAREALAVERAAGKGGNGGRLVRAFRLAVGAEAALAAGVLLAVGVITLNQPARDAWADQTRGIFMDRRAEDLQLRLRADPGTPGFNTYSLLVRDGRTGKPIPDAEKVALIFTMVEHDMGQNELVLQPHGDGWYSADTGLAAMAGTWRAEALVRRAGKDDVRTTLELKLDLPPPTISGQQPPPAGTPVAPAEARFLRNPIPAAQESLARGQQLYTQNCMVCHGVQGRGDGPAARTLRPPPADLSQHVTAHTEGELWWFITNGVQGTQMPAWKSVLTDNERWDLVNYIRSAFAPPAVK